MMALEPTGRSCQSAARHSVAVVYAAVHLVQTDQIGIHPEGALNDDDDEIAASKQNERHSRDERRKEYPLLGVHRNAEGWA